MSDIVIVGAARTAIGNFGGGLSTLSAVKLGTAAVRGVLERSGVPADEVQQLILGQVLAAADGQNPARQTALHAGLAQSSSALTINQVCGSGLRAVMLGAQQIVTGEAEVAVAGGQESMSLSAHAARLRTGIKMGAGSLIDTMMIDGLTDAFSGAAMGITAENVAKQFNLTREEQDAFAAASQNKAEAAQKSGAFVDEIIPVVVSGRKGDVTVDTDEFPRHGTTAESLSKLKPAFDKAGTVTAGNASGINDGAAALVLMHADRAAAKGLKPLARIVSYATAGVDPQIMGTGPIPASREALRKAGLQVHDLDLIEANEAFAAQALAVNREMGWDPERVNVNGGAVALGHPIGASGARVLVTLVHALKKRGGKYGLTTLCIGGGMGVALIIENI